MIIRVYNPHVYNILRDIVGEIADTLQIQEAISIVYRISDSDSDFSYEIVRD